MDVDELLDLLKEFEGKWCIVYFDDGSKNNPQNLKSIKQWYSMPECIWN